VPSEGWRPIDVMTEVMAAPNSVPECVVRVLRHFGTWEAYVEGTGHHRVFTTRALLSRRFSYAGRAALTISCSAVAESRGAKHPTLIGSSTNRTIAL